MNLVNFLINLISRKKLSSYEMVIKTIKQMGYKIDGKDIFTKEVSKGRTMIWITEKGVKIKVYAYGYAASDFLPGPISNPQPLKDFIRHNEL